VGPQDGLDDGRIRTASPGELVGDPGGFGTLLELADVLLAPPALHGHDCDEAAAGDDADDQQPPLEFRHVAGRIGRRTERTLGRE